VSRRLLSLTAPEADREDRGQVRDDDEEIEDAQSDGMLLVILSEAKDLCRRDPSPSARFRMTGD
jgi:hypothetical protein